MDSKQAGLSGEAGKEDEMNFTKSWEHSDVTFIVEDKKIYANKMTLGMTSSILKALLKAEKDKHDGIPLPGEDFDTFIELMKAVHPPNKEVDGSNVYRLLPLAKKYKMGHLTRRCEQFLLTLPPSTKSLALACEHEMPNLYDVCFKYAKSTPLGNLENQEDYKKIAPAVLIELLTFKLKTSFAHGEKVYNCLTFNGNSSQVLCKCMQEYGSHYPGGNTLCPTCKEFRKESPKLASLNMDCP